MSEQEFREQAGPAVKPELLESRLAVKPELDESRLAVKREAGGSHPPVKPDEASVASDSTRSHRPRGYIANYQPQPRTIALLDDVDAVLNEYRDHWPLTVRQIFYRLVGAFDFPKTEASYERLCLHMSNGRRARRIPFHAVRDDGVSVIDPGHFASADAFQEYVRSLAASYERDKMSRQPYLIEVWCEAAGMQPQLARVTEKYSIPVYSSSGFDSTTAKYGLAQRICEGYKPAVILHLGDLDPSGLTIFNAAAEDVRAFVLTDRLTKAVDVEFERVALIPAQVERLGLVKNAVKASSHSARWPYDYSCQLEALAPNQLASLLEAAIRRRLDADLLEEDVAAERLERRQLRYALPAPSGRS